MDISGLHDYILKEKVHIKENSHLLIPNKFRINTNETYLSALYTEEPITPYNVFTMFLCAKNEAKILVLYFNSVFYLVQFLVSVKQSTRGFTGISHVDLQRILIPDMSKIDSNKINEATNAFEEIRLVKFDSLLDQLKNKPEYRLKIDKTIADYLGIAISDDELKHLYDEIYSQISKSMK